jgi:hypothetical protein
LDTALRNGFEILINVGSDLPHQLEELTEFLHAVDPADFVIGTPSRAGQTDYTGFRQFLSRSRYYLARLLIPGGKGERATSMRAFSRKAFGTMKESDAPDDGCAFFTEAVEATHDAELRLAKVPIHFMDCNHGKSKTPRAQILISFGALGALAIPLLMKQTPSKRDRSNPLGVQLGIAPQLGPMAE